jgi:hypothetical protein
MLKRYTEKAISHFKGTIIDFETCSDFCREFRDSRQYKNIVPMIFGYINSDELQILCANGSPCLGELTSKINEILPNLERPFFAFNCHFEQGVFYHACLRKVIFDCELNKEKFEAKLRAVRELGISNYDDPFFDDGNKCKVSWLNGDYERSIRHNRSCLLKERDILLKRNHREPEDFLFCEEP